FGAGALEGAFAGAGFGLEAFGAAFLGAPAAGFLPAGFFLPAFLLRVAMVGRAPGPEPILYFFWLIKGFPFDHLY
ncbi:MAG TPA: hypothetical protein VM889_06965, partial [Candidatus Thermoplasmatota archaeon]|nr:hypothetical protein [Candidatus Thermoplasmatota archaeon]